MIFFLLCDECEQILTSNCVYFRRMKPWVPNSTVWYLPRILTQLKILSLTSVKSLYYIK